ncbi:hypothetical protein [Polyangium sp. y55x31]|uniref:hypothetical protein n=1 Tax=Polyangium sp. y55x31 TaxID=3042688 RepID=UPI00248290E4|nr:hypothetical protein [Polyangium sp. y55x31]MDI1484335.1 hypothetical protein [Polyangium sp. y55x31]
MSSPDSDAPGASDAGGHPLFPRPETATGPDTRKFDLIQIRRWGADGKMEVCPKAWKGSELRSWEQVVEMYGAKCTYQAVAQDGKNHQFSAFSEKLYFDGPPPKPFVEAPPPHPPSNAHAPQGYYAAPPAPYSGAGGSEMIAMMRVMFESNAAVQTAVLKLLVDSRQDGGSNVQTVLVSKLLDRLLERQAQNPLELLRDAVPLLQSLTSGGGNPKQFMQGVEFAKEMLGTGGGTSKSDDLGELASLIKTFMTVKASAAPTSAAPAPTPNLAGPQPATQSAPARPRKQRKSQPPPTTPGYPAAFPPWPWPYLPAHLYGMMHPAYQAWAAAYAQAMGSHPVAPPARPSAPPSAAASPVVPQTAPTSTTPHQAPAAPAPPPAAASTPKVAGHVAADEELAALSSTAAVMAEPAVADAVMAELAVADEEPAMADAAGDEFAVAQEEFDPLAPLRAMLADLHASQPPNPLAQDPSAMAVAPPLVQPPGIPALQGPLTGMPSVPPVDMATAFALYLSTLQPNPYGVPPMAAAAEPRERDEEEDDDDDADGDLPEDGSTVAMPGVIAMAAADPEFEATLPEELRPILRALMRKPGGGGLS